MIVVGGNFIEGRDSSQPTVRTINIIIWGIALRENSNSGCKQYAQQYTLTSRTTHDNLEDITFGSKDLEGISSSHDDAVVISTIVANFRVKRILIDNGSIANILFHETFIKMGISVEQLKAVKISHQGFWDEVIILKGVIELSLT